MRTAKEYYSEMTEKYDSMYEQPSLLLQEASSLEDKSIIEQKMKAIMNLKPTRWILDFRLRRWISGHGSALKI